jgi:ParB-like chromosome segregation protein Spo0J
MNCGLKLKEYMSLLPPLSEVEFNLLKQSIKEDGLHIPIIINKRGIILDGHHRFRACNELGIKPKYYAMEFKDLEEKQFVIEFNLRRRQLNSFQRVEMGYTLEGMEKENARILVGNSSGKT